MIKHCVFIKFSDMTSLQQRNELYRAIHNLRQHMSGWLGFVAGANVTPEPGMDKGFNGGFIIDFDNISARDNYLADARHQLIGAQIVDAAVGGIDGVMVFDIDQS